MERVLIIGNAGSGKSTLWRRIAETYQVPAGYLDRQFWRTGWKEPPEHEFTAAVEAAVAEPAWVMDGNYSRPFAIRMPAADTIIWLDLPRWLCLSRATWRWISYQGRTRPDMPEGCPGKIDLAFLRWIWDYPGRLRAGTLVALERHGAGKQVIILRSRADVRRFLASLDVPGQC
jgi:adenylate kinase family enzyme